MSVAAAVRSIGLRRIAGAGNSSVSSSSHNMNAPKPLSPENNIISVSVGNHAHDGGSDERAMIGARGRLQRHCCRIYQYHRRHRDHRSSIDGPIDRSNE